jgi:hypothetical protein
VKPEYTITVYKATDGKKLQACVTDSDWFKAEGEPCHSIEGAVSSALNKYWDWYYHSRLSSAPQSKVNVTGSVEGLQIGNGNTTVMNFGCK